MAGCPYLRCELDGLGQGELRGPRGLAGRLWRWQVASPRGGWGLRGRGGGGGRGGRGGGGGGGCGSSVSGSGSIGLLHGGGQELGLGLLQEELLLSWHQGSELWGRQATGCGAGRWGSREDREELVPEPSRLRDESSGRPEEGKCRHMRALAMVLVVHLGHPLQ